ncbi:MAG: hypothetical protein IIU18_00375 [Oscillospiraceae bacterium]|nr:hypothetical protein [Oscillospiraceae bacterium]
MTIAVLGGILAKRAREAQADPESAGKKVLKSFEKNKKVLDKAKLL